jgi:hypothetical protein
MQNWSFGEIARVFSEKGGVYLMMALFVIAATALYVTQAAARVELYPTRIPTPRFQYHHRCWLLGGLLPAIVFAINTATARSIRGFGFGDRHSARRL